ncbi:tetratricopeptide repeat protein [Azospirillum sp. SYSU D00513]|uniref:tetratricopeptide repeat protein n=1 Tax=Azospirillum sp. SYSU D00513 TaxID=2812561 RepID=UPI001A978705|nr:tetratricopeptide repeat protein [Azospirillum sp. SYSU D00513]
MHTEDTNPIWFISARDHLRAGRPDEAGRFCIALLVREPASAEGLMGIGLTHQLRGDPDEAGLWLGRSLVARSDHADAWGNRAALRALRETPDQALMDCAAALSLDPSLAAVHALRARLLYGREEHAAAAAAAGRALTLGLRRAELDLILIDGLRRQERLAEAGRLCRERLERTPERANLWVLLGLVLSDEGDDAAAAAASGRAVLLEPAHVTALRNRSDALLRLGRPVAAAAMLRAARAAGPHLPGAVFVPAWRRIGEQAQAAGNWLDALRAFEAAVREQPGDPVQRGPFAMAAAAVGQQSRAETALRIGLTLEPAAAGLTMNLGTILVNEGRVGEAERLLRRALALAPDACKAHSNLLFASQYRPGVTPAEHRAAHRAWHDRHAAPLLPRTPPAFPNDRDPERRLRVGIVSADLKRHPVGYFLAPFLAAHDRSRLALVCYASQPDEDAMTRALKGHVEGWRQVAALPDELLAETIRADSIDILIDLSGHTAGHRLPVFARRPAPVQMTWLGYVHTTGMPTIDGLIGGGLEIPPEAASWFEERLIPLPHGRFCYQPPEQAPAVAPPPSSGGGPVTFGSFNSLAKLSDATVSLWAGLLAAVPDARLLLKARPLHDPVVRGRIRARFAAAGVEPERIHLRGWSSHAAMLAEYGDMDVALDPRPFSGGLTSCEALWMGVPMVAWPGDTPAGRQSAHFLSLLGLDELIARSAEEYVSIAAALCRDSARLATLRAGMRARVLRSPLLDGAGFSRGMEDALRGAWRRWCANGAS